MRQMYAANVCGKCWRQMLAANVGGKCKRISEIYAANVGGQAMRNCKITTSQTPANPPETPANPPQTPANPPSARLCLRASILVGSLYLPPPSPPWVTRRGEKWREGDSHHLQHSLVTSLPSYLGRGDGQQQQQQFFHPHPSTQSAHSIPLPLPPYCTKCSILVWRGE